MNLLTKYFRSQDITFSDIEDAIYELANSI